MSGQPGNTNAVVHGARSDRTVATKARNHRRRFLRNTGLRIGDLDAIARAHLWHWARGQAVLDLRDAAGAAESKDYWHAYNATTRSMRELERRLKELGLDKAKPMPGRKLEAHLAARGTRA